MSSEESKCNDMFGESFNDFFDTNLFEHLEQKDDFSLLIISFLYEFISIKFYTSFLI